MCFIVNIQINKAVVGSGHRDVPNYMEEGVALCGLWGKSGGPNRHLKWVIFQLFTFLHHRCTFKCADITNDIIIHAHAVGHMTS